MPSASAYPLPTVRRLRVYAFDPQASVTLATAVINDFTIELPWESRWESPLQTGPVNDYVEVIDYDPAAGVFYEPVDLDDPHLLAQNGLAPSEGRPQFHQQMVFAVVMRTIRNFERALGRLVFWAGDHADAAMAGPLKVARVDRNFTKRLRIYPHALREANAYYSPQKRALLFGAFQPQAPDDDVDSNWVFTCLSQDIIAHEVTHAILHGMQQRSIEPSNIDMLAFHEAFADVVALLQHFQANDVLRQLLADNGGSLRAPGLLTGLAEQFGRATGRKGSLRYALEMLHDKSVEANDRPPTARARLEGITEAHMRGGVLVAAVFDAFVTIYERRTSDLFQIAGIRPNTDTPLPAALVARLADEAAKVGEQVLRMCVRALDYVPPVDLRFGEYLRAIITADTDLIADDPRKYRIAFIESFKRWGIGVPGCLSMAPDSLLWEAPRLEDFPLIVKRATQEGLPLDDPANALNALFVGLLSRLQLGLGFADSPGDKLGAKPILAEPGTSRLNLQVSAYDYHAGRKASDNTSEPDRLNLRDMSMQVVLFNQARIHEWFNLDSDEDPDWERLLGMRLMIKDSPAGALGSVPTVTRSGKTDFAFEVHSARISRRPMDSGQELPMLIVQMTQQRRGYFDPAEQAAADRGDYSAIGEVRKANPDFMFRGGATLHIDLRDGRLLRIIRKRIDNQDRLEEERAFRTGKSTGTRPAIAGAAEPFAFLHRGEE